MRRQNSRRQASSFAWVILAALFIGLAASFGMRASFGAYIAPWELEFSSNRALVASISMLSFVVFAFSQPLLGKLNDHFGKNTVPAISLFLMGASLILTSMANQIWQVFVLYGIGFSIGVAGCCSVIAAAIITNWFVEKRGLALGLVMSGMGVGQLILIPANLFMIERMGWRDTMPALSIIIMVIAGPLYLFCLRSRPEEKGLRPYGVSDSGDSLQSSAAEAADSKSFLPVIGVFKQRSFWLLSVTYFICGFTDVGLIQTHLIPIVEFKGFPVSVAAIAFSLIAVSNIGGTIVTGYLSDYFKRARQLAVIYSIRAAAYILLIAVRRPWQLLIFAVMQGSMDMASIAPTNSLTVQLFSRYSIGMVIGIISVSHQLGGALGSWIPGLLYDFSGSYYFALTLSVFMLIGGALAALKIPESGVNIG